MKKTYDADAEEFIISWAQEFPLRDPLVLTVHVNQIEPAQQTDSIVEKAIHHYFHHRAKLTRMELGRMMRDGRLSLPIGVVILSVCLMAAQLIGGAGDYPVRQVAREGLIIVGWVAMWRPLQIYLYDWSPLRRRWKIFEKMGRMRIEIKQSGEAHHTASPALPPAAS